MQTKFSLSYIVIIIAVLILLNSYPLVVSENLVFRSKETALKNSVSLMVTSLSGLEELSEGNVASAMTFVEQTSVSRILITDASGLILYDTRETENAQGRYGLYTEIVQALRGYDVFYTEFFDGAFRSRAASPVIYRNQTIGAVYAYEYDIEQATLLLNLQKTLLRISMAVAAFVALLSGLLSRMLTRRFGILAEAIVQIREGAYSYRAEIGGHDEVTQIATEFNSLADRLQTTEDARRRFVSDASHELKTPLAGIRLLSDSILQTEDMDADTVREFVGDIGQEAQRLTRITENLLRLTRLDSGVEEDPVLVSFSPSVLRAVRMLNLVAKEKKVDLHCEILQGGSVFGSEEEVHQIVYNLTENAIKYNLPGGFVRVVLSRDEEDCILTVEDNGIGIPEEDMPRVFDRFYRVDKMRSRAAGGTGLGLSIVADTVHRRGGTVEVCAREGGGCRFTVRLPFCGEEESV
ncbi:MAG: HAMP domain-containing histidine kinase [Oscillospiraceae bacterium]|nr:HAMP domain-containing histidine kinase [Oscillospiraceae bacterium]